MIRTLRRANLQARAARLQADNQAIDAMMAEANARTAQAMQASLVLTLLR